MSPSAALGQEGLSDFPGLNDPDGLEEGWAVMQTVPSAGLSDVFLVISLGLWVWRGRPQRGSALLITSRQGCAVNMTPHHGCTLGPLAEVYLSCVSTGEFLFLPLPMPFSLWRCHHTWPTLKRGFGPHSQRTEHSHI